MSEIDKNPFSPPKEVGIRPNYGALGKYGVFSWFVVATNLLTMAYFIGVTAFEVRLGGGRLMLFSFFWCAIGVPVSSVLVLVRCHKLRPLPRLTLFVVNALVLIAWYAGIVGAMVTSHH